MRRWLIIGAAAALAVLVVGSTVLKALRDREWANGGKAVTARIEYRVADAAGLPAAVAALGGPTRHAAHLRYGGQAVVARLTWDGPASDGGQYHLVLLDRRATPAQLLGPYESWNERGDTGLVWDGRFGELAKHYDWLTSTADRRHAEEGASLAVSADATANGTLLAVFLVGDDRLLVAEPREDLIGTLFLTDAEGNVRWAKKV